VTIRLTSIGIYTSKKQHHLGSSYGMSIHKLRAHTVGATDSPRFN